MMLSKEAFEKALQEDKAKVNRQIPASNIQFKNKPPTFKPPSNQRLKRDMLWEEKKKKKLLNSNPLAAGPMPAPVIKSNPPPEKKSNNISFPGAAHPPMEQNFPVEENRFSFENNVNSGPVMNTFEPEVVAPMPPPQPNPYSNQYPVNQPQNMNFNNDIPASEPSGYNNNGGFAVDSEDMEAKQKKQALLNDYKREMQEREDRKKREKQEEKRREREEMQKYSNPFGKGGAGAPNRNWDGKIITNRKPVAQMQQQMPQWNPPPQQMPQSFDPPPQPMISNQAPMQPNVQYMPPVQPQQNAMYNQYQPPIQPQPSFQPENPYEFQPPVMPHNMNQNQNQNFPVYNQRGMTPPVINQPQNLGEVNAYGNQFHPPPSYPQMNNNMPSAVNQNNSIDMIQPSIMSNNAKRIMTPNYNQNGFDVGAPDDVIKQRKNQVKNQWQRELLEQMEEKKRAKEEEKRKRDLEEMEEERKIQRERDEIEMRFKQEEEKKKREMADLQRANEDIMMANKRAQEKKANAGRCEMSLICFYIAKEKPPSAKRKFNRENLFGNGPQPPMQFQQPPPVQQQTVQPEVAQPQMGKTRMMNEIQEQIKATFDSELDKLRQEMSSRQKALRNQMEGLK